MKVKINWSKIWPHLIIIVFFLLISVVYCMPILEGKSLLGHDIESWLYMAKETLDYNAGGHDQTFWTNSMFGGMPTYQIAAPMGEYSIISYMPSLWRWLPSPAGNIFVYLIGAYILFLCLRFNKWLSVLGAIALTFFSYNFIILLAGHASKAWTIGYIMPLIGSVYVLFRGNRLMGTLLTALFLGLSIGGNHLQILYYALFIILAFGIVELVYAIRQKKLKGFFASVALGCCALILAVGLHAPLLLTTYQYSKMTMRGESNGLTDKGGQVVAHGLNKDYITQWSYGIDESFTLLVPDFKGGASGGTLSVDSETAKSLERMNVPNVKKVMSGLSLPLYWGTQPFTSGPVYLGAILCFLFVLGLFLVKKRYQWWLIPVVVLTLMLSWGRNFMPLTDFFIDYIPLYNKFRTVSMILVVTCLAMGIMGMLGLKALLNPETDKGKALKAVKYAFFITGGFALLFALFPFLSGNFIGLEDGRLAGDYEFLRQTLPLDRESLLRSDAIRSFVFIALAALVLWLYLKSKLKVKYLYLSLIVLILVDLWVVDKRYLNDAAFSNKKNENRLITPSDADRFILQDTSYYRVLDGTVNIFNDAKPAYFHKLIGGYNAAKLSRYQELIDNHLEGEIKTLFAGMSKIDSEEQLTALMQQLRVLNMLNMKYIIYNPKAQPLINPEANGNAWFVDSYRIAETPDEEMKLLGEIDTKTEFVADKRFAGEIPVLRDRDTTATISLKSYAPNRLEYQVHSKSDQIAVFSEIYYKDGWNVYLDGEKVPYFRANYLLRAMSLKAGSYELEFRFEPRIVVVTKMISLAASILFLLFLGLVIYNESRKKTA